MRFGPVHYDRLTVPLKRGTTRRHEPLGLPAPRKGRRNLEPHMTTTVMIAVQSNKEVAIETPNGRMVLPPGKWFSTSIHGEQSLKISETGGFVDPGPGLRFEDAPKAESAAITG